MTAIIFGVLLPLFGTALGAAGVFFLRGEGNRRLHTALSGFAAGIMVAASVWSLLIPAIEASAEMGKLSFLPAMIGLLCGVGGLILIDLFIPRLYAKAEEKKSSLCFAVTLHNLPEGMAVGAVFAGLIAGEAGITLAAAMTLSFGVAIQNIPEGAIVSMPQYSRGKSKGRAFLTGAASGIVEPIGAAVTILAASIVVPILPFLLGFAAGAMLYVVVEELIPEVASGGFPCMGNLMFALGFSLMMALDVALG